MIFIIDSYSKTISIEGYDTIENVVNEIKKFVPEELWGSWDIDLISDDSHKAIPGNPAEFNVDSGFFYTSTASLDNISFTDFCGRTPEENDN